MCALCFVLCPCLSCARQSPPLPSWIAHLMRGILRSSARPHSGICSLSFAACMYIMVAWAGYFIYGNAIGAAGIDGNILNRLSNGAPKIVAQALITTHVFSAFGVLIQPVLVQLERALGLPEPCPSFCLCV